MGIVTTQSDKTFGCPDEDTQISLVVFDMAYKQFGIGIGNAFRIVINEQLQIIIALQLQQNLEKLLSQDSIARGFQIILLHGKEPSASIFWNLFGEEIHHPKLFIKKVVYHRIFRYYFASLNASESSFICALLIPSGSKPMLRALM